MTTSYHKVLEFFLASFILVGEYVDYVAALAYFDSHPDTSHQEGRRVNFLELVGNYQSIMAIIPTVVVS